MSNIINFPNKNKSQKKVPPKVEQPKPNAPETQKPNTVFYLIGYWLILFAFFGIIYYLLKLL